MNLYQIKQEHFALLLELQNGEGELTPQLEARLTAIEAALDDKIEACCVVIKNMDAIVSAHDAEIKRLTERRKTIEKSIERLKGWVGSCIGPEGWQRGVHRLSWRKSESIEVDDVEALGMELCLPPKLQPDRKAIKRELEAGIAVPGCRIVESQNLQVK